MQYLPQTGSSSSNSSDDRIDLDNNGIEDDIEAYHLAVLKNKFQFWNNSRKRIHW